MYSTKSSVCKIDFIFSKENILGTEVLDLASQTKEIYNDLERRTIKLENYFLSNL